MITPRLTRLLRVPHLPALHAALADLVEPLDPFGARACAMLVPTRGAAEALRRTLERELLDRRGRRAITLPDILTRDELYARWHQRLPDAPPVLSELEREVLFRRAARDVVAAGTAAPFHMRPGLVPQILAFYDELRRRDRSVGDFARLMVESLGPSADYDRGADRLLRQTRFLAAAFEAFEQAVEASGRIDEHGLRRRLIDSAAGIHRHVVITLTDQAADPAGLWSADYDLFARVPGLERIDIVATENVLASGYHQRIHDRLPGLEEQRLDAGPAVPVLEAPERKGLEAAPPCFVCRDREEELVEVARRVKLAAALDGFAVVFQRPLPYLYLARGVFAAAEIPYQALDALPLAAEPFAAAVDLVFTCATTDATRVAIVELLGSPQWRFATADGREIDRHDVFALDRWLREQKHLGGRSLRSDSAGRPPESLAPMLDCAASVAEAIAAIESRPSASQQFGALIDFVRAHERLPADGDAAAARHLRARAAVLAALASLAEAHARHDDRPLDIGELAAAVRRWIEGQVFSPRTGWSGIMLLDAPSAAYADVDEARIVGMVESDWPDRGTRSIFYPAGLLTQLGWPAEADRLAAARARFRDLLRLPRQRLSASTFTLEDDAIVSPSPLVEEIETSGLPIERRRPEGAPRVFVHEALAEAPLVAEAATGEAAEWLAVRMARSPQDARAYHGFAGDRAPGPYAVSHVERYLDCPFKYFAAHVLRLDEEREDESGLTPQQRGQLLHDVFEHFFGAWHRAGRQAITIDNVGEALEMFAIVTEERIANLSEADRGLERNYLLGSAAASGLAERAFAFEIEHGVGVVERLLEHPLEGEFEFSGGGTTRTLRIRAKADRIDLLDDGTLRVIDYKLGRAPKATRALQLPIYGVCAEQHLAGRHGRAWTLGRAGYVAFREKNAFVPLGSSSSLEDAIDDGQTRLLEAVAAIERGEFPPDPDEPFLCTRCAYPTVCRKDYVGDE